MILQYREHNGPCYLELHALRAPVGGYREEFQTSASSVGDPYDFAVQHAIRMFEEENAIEIYQLGRSGRHICIEDTPRNRKRYASLQRKAIVAAKAMWAEMRTAD